MFPLFSLFRLSAFSLSCFAPLRIFFASDYETRMWTRKIAGERYFRIINRVLSSLHGAKAFASKTNHPSQKWHPSWLSAAALPLGALVVYCWICPSNLVHTYHLGIPTYLHTTCIHTDYVCIRYIGRICIMKNVVRCGLSNCFSFFLFT